MFPSQAASLPTPTVEDLKFEKPLVTEFDVEISHVNNLENIFCVNCSGKLVLLFAFTMWSFYVLDMYIIPIQNC